MTTIQKIAIREALRQALCGTFFNLTGVVNAGKILGIDVYGIPEKDTLTALHCTQWKNLSEAECKEVIELVMQVLGVDFRAEFTPEAVQPRLKA